jgi:protein SCO1/2
MRFPRSLLLLGALLMAAASLSGHSGSGAGDAVGIEPKLGGSIPLDGEFTGEDGRPVSLRQLIRAPTILILLYYRCANACSTLVLEAADAVRLLSAVPGRDYLLLTVSIDPRETPADAAKVRRIALESIQKPFPPDAWRFLTGGEESIDELADAVGFRFRRNGDEFDHPLALVILSPQGKITRYMTGPSVLPMDLSLALLEASEGRVGPTVAKVIRFCFSYDPQKGHFVFNTLKVSAIVVLTLVLALGLYLALSGNRRRAGQGASR